MANAAAGGAENAGDGPDWKRDRIRVQVYRWCLIAFVVTWTVGMAAGHSLGYAVVTFLVTAVLGLIAFNILESLSRLCFRLFWKQQRVLVARIAVIFTGAFFALIGGVTMYAGLSAPHGSSDIAASISPAAAATQEGTNDIRTVTSRSGSYPCVTTYKKLMEYAAAASDINSSDYDNHALLNDAMSDAVRLTAGTRVRIDERNDALSEVKLTVESGHHEGQDCFIPSDADNYQLFREGP